VAIAFQYCFRNVSRMIQVNQEQLKFDGAHHKVVNVTDLSRVEIELFTLEDSSLIEINRHLRRMCVDSATDVRCWVCCFKSGE
jgi:hypothetical protein